MERVQLAERVSGKMRRAIGRVLEGKSREELERIAAKDQRLARASFVKVRRGERFSYKHIDDLTCDDCWDRIEAERVTAMWWLRGGREDRGSVARERQRQPYGHASENPAWPNFVELRKPEVQLRRIHFLRGSVNKGWEKGGRHDIQPSPACL